MRAEKRTDLGYLKWFLLQVLLIIALFSLMGLWATTAMTNVLAASLGSAMVLGHLYAIRRIHLSAAMARSWERYSLLIIPLIFLLITAVFTADWILGAEKPFV